MNRKSMLALIVGGVMIAGSLMFYFWNEEVRPEALRQQQQRQALAGACKVHDAARGGDLVLLNQMFDAGCSMNGRDDFGMTPLHVAANDRVAAFLLSQGAYLDAADGRGFTPLKVMQMAGRKDVVELLRRRGAKP